ncbi:dTMP kinase [Lentzea albidocapillata]|uniref:Thymidylate kinase n=1 Tax=Lentzea albidocapillata TaxID=40571 RepID=A0A1W2B9X7_9PSEU|nr:dTMP kinase [Lentzea albidocapillata]SMC69178.1 dTMP kinase [Lentzea albidocapillata]
MGKLVVIEGLDGAGKRTLANGLTEALAAQGRTVAGHAFPRYGVSVHADLVRDGLYGRLGDLSESVYGMAVLYALDRRGAADEIRKDLEEHDVVLLDRYVASSAAYSAARLHQDEHGEFVRWVHELEIERFGLPVPDLQLLLRVPVEVAAERAAKREQADESRARDIYESDGSLQARCGVVYDGLANIGWLSPWQVVDGRSNVNFHSLLEPLFTP